MNQHIAFNEVDFEDLRINIPSNIMEDLQSFYRISNLMMINFKAKFNVVAKKYYSFIQRYNFNTRYFHDLEYINFKSVDNEKRYRKPDASILREVLNEPKKSDD